MSLCGGFIHGGKYRGERVWRQRTSPEHSPGLFNRVENLW